MLYYFFISFMIIMPNDGGAEAQEGKKTMEKRTMIQMSESKTKGTGYYQFPKLTRDDLKELKNYGLKVMCAMPDDDVVVRGKVEDLERFATEILDYELNADYLHLIEGGK